MRAGKKREQKSYLDLHSVISVHLLFGESPWAEDTRRCFAAPWKGRDRRGRIQFEPSSRLTFNLRENKTSGPIIGRKMSNVMLHIAVSEWFLAAGQFDAQSW